MRVSEFEHFASVLFIYIVLWKIVEIKFVLPDSGNVHRLFTWRARWNDRKTESNVARVGLQ